MKRTSNILVRGSLAGLLVVAAVGGVHAGVFLGESNVVTHPRGYTGTGGNIMLTVCIDPSSSSAATLVIPVQNVIRTWNGLAPALPNLIKPAPDIAGSQWDFESLALHELGHCIGLNHPNLAAESGVGDNLDDSTRSDVGANFNYDLDDGADGVYGSKDDVRGDDVNWHWFRKGSNDPFTIAAIVDSTTYGQSLLDLPMGHLFVANAGRDVASKLGYPKAESVMQQGQFNDEDRRRLNHDDVATFRLGMSGLDMIAGTSDDYTLTLVYGGMATGCGIDVNYNASDTGTFGFCTVSTSAINATHERITSAQAFFGAVVPLYFNQVPNIPTVTPTPSVTPTPTLKPTPVCGVVPDAGCRTPAVGAKAFLQIKDRMPDEKDAMQWKWSAGSVTTMADFGDPVNSDTYELCIYDDTPMLISKATAPAAQLCGSNPKPCWSAKSTSIKYKDNDLTPDGIQQMTLKQGLTPGKAQIQIKGKGLNLDTPAGFPILQPVRVQLKNSSGVCWEATYSAPASKNTAGPPAEFKDKAD